MINDVGEKRTLKIVDLRKRAGLSQAELAKRLKIRRPTISDWETKGICPKLPPSRYWLLMQHLNCSLEELIEAFEGEEILQELKKN